MSTLPFGNTLAGIANSSGESCCGSGCSCPPGGGGSLPTASSPAPPPPCSCGLTLPPGGTITYSISPVSPQTKSALDTVSLSTSYVVGAQYTGPNPIPSQACPSVTITVSADIVGGHGFAAVLQDPVGKTSGNYDSSVSRTDVMGLKIPLDANGSGTFIVKPLLASATNLNTNHYGVEVSISMGIKP